MTGLLILHELYLWEFQQPGKPSGVAVARCAAGVRDCGYLLSRTNFTTGFVSVDPHDSDPG